MSRGKCTHPICDDCDKRYLKARDIYKEELAEQLEACPIDCDWKALIEAEKAILLAKLRDEVMGIVTSIYGNHREPAVEYIRRESVLALLEKGGE